MEKEVLIGAGIGGAIAGFYGFSLSGVWENGAIDWKANTIKFGLIGAGIGGLIGYFVSK